MTPAVDQNAAKVRAPQPGFWIAVVLIFLAGLALRVQTFTLAWTGVHNSWGGAFYGNVARNFLRYGWQTSFAPMVSSGVVDPSQFEFYYHHPPFSMWLTALSFQAFGVHEWSARLVPLIFSLMTMALVFSFARAAFGNATALCALLFMAVLPVDTYYATHVDPNSSVSIFFTALAVEGYRRWLVSRSGRDYALIAISLVFGCMTGWFTYLIVPGIVGHAWLIQREPDRRAVAVRAWLLPLFAFGVFGLFVLHRKLALAGARPEVFDALGDRLLKRTVGFDVGRMAIMKIYLRNVWNLYTLPFVALSAAWVLLFVQDAWKKRLQNADWGIAILFSYGVLYAIAFPGHLQNHDFFVRTYAPGVALASALVVSRMARAFSEPTVRRTVVAVVIAGACGIATLRTRSLYASDDMNNGPTLRGFGEAVATLGTPRDPVFLPIKDDRVMQYYVDRPTTFGLDTPEKLQAALATVKGRYLILLPERNSAKFAEMLAYLEAHYPERRDKALFIFQGGDGSSAK